MLGKHNFVSKVITYIGIVLLFLIIFIVVYAPVLQIPYLVMSDYEFIREHYQSGENLVFANLITQGRGLEVFSHVILTKYIKSSESSRAIRFLGIIGITLFASVTYAIFKRYRFRADHAFLMSALICFLPSIQIIAAWMILVLSIYPALLSSLSALLLFSVVFKKEVKRKAYKVIWVLTAVILLVAALNINQPPAMMYWAVGIIFLLTGNNYDFLKKERRLHVITYFFVGLISILIYYVVFIKMIPFITNVSIPRASLVSIRQIPYKIEWFITKPFVNAMNLWNTDPTYQFAIFIGAIIFVGIIISILREFNEKKINFGKYLQRYLLILCAVVLSYLPNLVILEPWYPYRTLVSLTAALSILFCFGLINFMEFFKFVPKFSVELRKTTITILLIIITIISAILAHNTVKKFAVLHFN